MGFRNSKKQLNLKVPEGMVVLALNSIKASAAPEDSKENINGGIKNMKKSKGMQLGALLAAGGNTLYEGFWNVPSAPLSQASPVQSIFYFTALQNNETTGKNSILQPVLE